MTALPVNAGEIATLVIVGDVATVSVIVAAMTYLRAALTTDRDAVRAALADDASRQAVDDVVALLNLADIVQNGEVLRVAGGIAMEGLAFLSRERPDWFLEGQGVVKAAALPAAASPSPEAN